MERHAALPQPQHAQGIKKHLGLVENTVAKPPAENDAKRRVKNEIINMAFGHRRAGLSNELRQIPPAEHDACNITQRVPAQLEPAKIKQNWIKAKLVITYG